MLRTKLSALCACVLTAGALLLTACAGAPPDPTLKMTPEQMYADAKDDISVGAYDKAITTLEKLEGRAAGTVLAQQAELDKAYALYKSEEPAKAIATLNRFIKLHPASPALDYALYYKGIINFNDDLGLFSSISRMDLSERDQQAAKESYETFKELVTRFPDSKYTPDARLRMTYIVNSLAQYEVHVARYYYSRGAYLAAINRAQAAISDYQGAPAREEALALLIKSYDALNLTQLRDDAIRVQELNYPKQDAVSKTRETAPSSWWKFW